MHIFYGDHEEWPLAIPSHPLRDSANRHLLLRMQPPDLSPVLHSHHPIHRGRVAYFSKSATGPSYRGASTDSRCVGFRKGKARSSADPQGPGAVTCGCGSDIRCPVRRASISSRGTRCPGFVEPAGEGLIRGVQLQGDVAGSRELRCAPNSMSLIGVYSTLRTSGALRADTAREPNWLQPLAGLPTVC